MPEQVVAESKPPVSPNVDTFEKELFEHAVKLVNETINQRQRQKFDELVDRNEKRFTAMRSIRGLDWGDLPKNKPWPGASDVGIPVDAITIQAIVARTDRVEWERFPLTHVTGVGPNDLVTAPKIAAFLDWQKTNKMRLRIPKMMATRRACIDGSYFWKTVWEEDWTYDDEEIFALKDPDTGKLLRDERDELVEWNPDEPPALNESSKPFQVVPGIITPRKRTFYNGPRVFGRSIKQILWPQDATDPDPNKWPWWADTYYRSMDWLEEHGKEIGFKNIDQLKANMADKTRDIDRSQTTKKNIKTRDILIVEWHGKKKKNGKLRDVIAFWAKMPNVTTDGQKKSGDTFLGWEFDTVKQRTGLTTLIHRQIIPMDGRVVGMSVISFIRGLRDTIDVVFNQMMDRGSRNNNPPIVYEKGSGFNPNVHNYGYRFWPEKTKGSLRVLELPKGEQIEFAKLELLFQMVQRLFGVTDPATGVSDPNNQTLGGIQTLLAQGNVNIDMIISSLNESNIMLDKMIIKLNAIFMGEGEEESPEDTLEFPVIDSYSEVIEDPDNPFASITRQELLGDYNYMPTGSTLTVNTRSIREEAAVLYKLVLDSAQANPFFADLNIIREASNDLVKGFNKKNYRLKSVEDVQQEQAQQAEAALALAGEGGEGGQPQP